jgi:DNA-binding PadR family transcriptional regulator
MIKPRPNHGIYLEILRRMTPEQRLRKAFELSEMGRELFRQGLRQRYPDLSPEDVEALLRKRLSLCHNRNY